VGNRQVRARSVIDYGVPMGDAYSVYWPQFLADPSCLHEVVLGEEGTVLGVRVVAHYLAHRLPRRRFRVRRLVVTADATSAFRIGLRLS
jgi:hypothetical protein